MPLVYNVTVLKSRRTDNPSKSSKLSNLYFLKNMNESEYIFPKKVKDTESGKSKILRYRWDQFRFGMGNVNCQSKIRFSNTCFNAQSQQIHVTFLKCFNDNVNHTLMKIAKKKKIVSPGMLLNIGIHIVSIGSNN